MRESKHTPGPWQVVGTPFNEGFTVLAQPHPALRGFTKCVAYVGDKATEENEANARLIAAATDLLRVLRNWLEAEDTWDGDFADDDRITRAKEAARAVLSKIEGRP